MSKKVFVSGCYDMLHSGHVAFFKEASTHGDLYVGIGSDATIQDLKDRKTINTEQERLYMVKAIRYVKDAFINSGSGMLDFAEDVKALKPDIFFVNSDGYTPGKKRFCEENGYVRKNGKPRATAEILYRYITGQHDFTEEHQGLDDVLIEIEISAKCFAQHKPMRKLLFAR